MAIVRPTMAIKLNYQHPAGRFPSLCRSYRGRFSSKRIGSLVATAIVATATVTTAAVRPTPQQRHPAAAVSAYQMFRESIGRGVGAIHVRRLISGSVKPSWLTYIAHYFQRTCASGVRGDVCGVYVCVCVCV